MPDRSPWLVRALYRVRTANRIAFCEPVRTAAYLGHGALIEAGITWLLLA